MINTWINAFMKPTETLTSEKGNASFGKGLVNYVVAGLLAGIVTYVVTAAGFGAAGAFGGVVATLASPFMIVTSIIGAIIGSIIGGAIIWVIAKVLGGTGSFTQQYFLASLYAPVAALLSSIPLVGLLVGLYSIYLLYKTMMIAHGLSSGRAIAVIVILVVVIFILVMIFAAMLLALLAAAGLGALGTMGSGGFT